jgi:hypothetical protein
MFDVRNQWYKGGEQPRRGLDSTGRLPLEITRPDLLVYATMSDESRDGIGTREGGIG